MPITPPEQAYNLTKSDDGSVDAVAADVIFRTSTTRSDIGWWSSTVPQGFRASEDHPTRRTKQRAGGIPIDTTPGGSTVHVRQNFLWRAPFRQLAVSSRFRVYCLLNQNNWKEAQNPVVKL